MLLQLATAGDELQGIKKGVMELADAVVINKADIDRQKTELARQQYENALHILRPKSRNWQVPVLTVSALKNEGIPDVWEMLVRFRSAMEKSGELADTRKRQAVDWMWSLLMEDLKTLFLNHKEVRGLFPQVQEAVAQGITTPSAAARRLLDVFRR